LLGIMSSVSVESVLSFLDSWVAGIRTDG
jgi:hypothetical protein